MRSLSTSDTTWLWPWAGARCSTSESSKIFSKSVGFRATTRNCRCGGRLRIFQSIRSARHGGVWRNKKILKQNFIWFISKKKNYTYIILGDYFIMNHLLFQKLLPFLKIFLFHSFKSLKNDIFLKNIYFYYFCHYIFFEFLLALIITCIFNRIFQSIIFFGVLGAKNRVLNQ